MDEAMPPYSEFKHELKVCVRCSIAREYFGQEAKTIEERERWRAEMSAEHRRALGIPAPRQGGIRGLLDRAKGR